MYVLNYFTGKKKNLIVINDWYQYVASVFQANFAHVGIGKQGTSTVFFQESAS